MPRILLDQNQLFMALLNVEVREPTRQTVDFLRHTLWSKKLTRRLTAKPHYVILQKRKNLLIRNCVLITNNHELLLVLHQRRHVLAKQRERRVRHDDVRLIEQRQALLGAEIAVTLKLSQFVLAKLEQVTDILHIHAAVPGRVTHRRDDRLIGLRLAVTVLGNGRPLITSRNQFLQSETFEVQHEKLEEVALKRVVAVAEHRLIFEVPTIMTEFLLDIRQLCIKLIVLRTLRRA